MRSLISLLGGGVIVHIWKKTPAIIKIPAIFGLGLLTASELTIDGNHAIWSGSIFHGQAAEGDAKVADPLQTLEDAANDKPVTGANLSIAAQIMGLLGEGRNKTLTADAAGESIDEIIGKENQGLRLTSTESLRLKEFQLKEQEVRKAKAEADIKAAEASAAAEKAKAEIASAQYTQQMLGPNGPMATQQKFLGMLLGGKAR